MSFSIESRINDIIATLREAQQELSDFTYAAAADVSLFAVETLSEKSPFDEAPNNDSPEGEEGHLRDSFAYMPSVTTGNEDVMLVYTEQPIKFQYVTQGTLDAAPIEPVEKKALWWPDAPHPLHEVAGQDPNPFQEEALAIIQGEIPAIVTEALAPVFDTLRNL